jgi:hypothetical protein
MLRRVGISVRLNVLAGLFTVAVIGLIGVVYYTVSGQVTTQKSLVALADTQDGQRRSNTTSRTSTVGRPPTPSTSP